MNESRVDINLFKKKVVSGIVVLGIRRVIYQLILTISNIILARVLSPEIFGGFAIISFLVLTLGLLTDFGLGPALTQKKGDFNQNQLRSIFTVLLISAMVFVVIIYFLAPYLNVIYGGKLDAWSIFWLRIYSLIMVTNHLMVIPVQIMQRNLEYRKLATGELTVLFITQLIAIIMALKGFGIGSFVIGNLTGGIAAFCLFFYLSPWKIGLRFSYSDLKYYLPFGLNYQASTLITAVNSSVVPGYVGAVAGAEAVGLVNWANGIRQVGLVPFDVVEKIIFPAASRVQDNKNVLKILIEKMIRISSMLSLPLITIIFALAPSVIIIIYTSKWLTGLTAVYLCLIQGLFVLLCNLMVDVLLALGKADKARNINIYWALLQWIFTIPLVYLMGFNGAVLAGVIVSATFFLPLREVRKYLNIEVWGNIFPYICYSLITCIFTFVLSKVIQIRSLWELLIVAAAGMMFYIILLFVFESKSLIKDILDLRELLLQKGEYKMNL